MYGSLLQSANTIYEHRQAIADLAPKEKEPMSLVDLSSTYSVCIKTMDGSRINLMSATICIKLAEMFAGEYGVGIITPYSAQSRLVLAKERSMPDTINGILDNRYLLLRIFLFCLLCQAPMCDFWVMMHCLPKSKFSKSVIHLAYFFIIIGHFLMKN